jgi:cytochrome c-type biogenesis protein CcmH
MTTMTIFWMLLAGLAALALLFVLPPLLRPAPAPATPGQDENQLNLALFQQQLQELEQDLAAGVLDRAQFEAARHDLEKGLLQDIHERAPAPPVRSGRWAALVLPVALPAAAFALYLGVGEHTAIDRVRAAAVTTPGSGPDGQPMPDMATLVERLARRMEQNPDNLDGWVMLGRSYLAMGQADRGVQAYERALALAADHPEVLLGYAEALAKTRQSLDGRPAELIASVLEIEPANPNGLWMMGLVEVQRGNPAAALPHWTRLEGLLEPGSEDAATVRQHITRARRQAGLDPEPAAPAQTGPAATPAPGSTQTPTQAPAPEQADRTTAPAPAAGTTGTLRVEVTLADTLADQAPPDATLFVFARALSGPPMPLAVQRLRVTDLPARVTLDDSMAMMPQMRLSAFPQVLVGARISPSGSATAQSGDLQGEVQPVTPGQAETVRVVIDSLRP